MTLFVNDLLQAHLLVGHQLRTRGGLWQLQHSGLLQQCEEHFPSQTPHTWYPRRHPANVNKRKRKQM